MSIVVLRRWGVLAIILAILLTAFSVQRASAAPSLVIQPNVVAPGGGYVLAGAGYNAGETVNCVLTQGVTTAGAPVLQGFAVMADATGAFSTPGAIPAGVAAGSIVIFTCTGAVTGAFALANLGIVAPAPPPIPEAEPFVLLGIGLLALAAYFWMRRRSPSAGPATGGPPAFS